jgi:hypothetical protein
MSPIVMPFITITSCFSMITHSPKSQGSICTQFLEAENVPVLPWPAHSADMSPIVHVWDALDLRVQQHVQVYAYIQQLRTEIEEEWYNTPQATINSLIKSMQSKCVTLHEVTPYWFLIPHYCLF